MGGPRRRGRPQSAFPVCCRCGMPKYQQKGYCAGCQRRLNMIWQRQHRGWPDERVALPAQRAAPRKWEYHRTDCRKCGMPLAGNRRLSLRQLKLCDRCAFVWLRIHGERRLSVEDACRVPRHLSVDFAICRRCGGPRSEADRTEARARGYSSAFCLACCLAYRRESTMRIVCRRREEGRCLGCGRARDDMMQTCASCRAKMADWRRRQKLGVVKGGQHGEQGVAAIL